MEQLSGRLLRLSTVFAAGRTITGWMGKSCRAQTCVQGNARGFLSSLTFLQRVSINTGEQQSQRGRRGPISNQQEVEAKGEKKRASFFISTTGKLQRWRFAPPLVTFPSRCLAEEREGGGDSSRCRYGRAQLSSKSRCLAPTAASSGLSASLPAFRQPIPHHLPLFGKAQGPFNGPL